MCTSLKAASAPTFTAPKKEGRRTDGRTPVSDVERETRSESRHRRPPAKGTVGGDVDGGGRPDVRVQATGQVAEHNWEVAFMQTVETLWR